MKPEESMMFGILQECTVTGRKHWIQWHANGTGFAAAFGPPTGIGTPGRLAYEDRALAEQHAEKLRADNAKQVVATKRSRKFKTHLATYTIIDVDGGQ